jgi:hypothetical protein
MSVSANYYGFLAALDWDRVHVCFDIRVAASESLLDALDGADAVAFARMALAMDGDPSPNYSADDHKLGPKVFASNREPARRLKALANQFVALTAGRTIPDLVRAADLTFCKVGVASEMSCLVNPARLWVCNARTLWTSLLVKHGVVSTANEELKLYRESNSESEMYWPVWKDLHKGLERVQRRLIEESAAHTIRPEDADFLWADAICNVAYEDMAE